MDLRVSPTVAVTVEGVNASLASAPIVMGMFLARVRKERRTVGIVEFILWLII